VKHASHVQTTALRTPTACPICAGQQLRTRPFGYAFNDRWLGAYECRECGIIFIHPQPTSDELAQLYSKEYFEGDFRCGHAGSYFDEKTQASLADEQLLARIKALKPAGAFLEVGCAGGAFLHAARNAGYDVTGVEFSDVAAQLARDKFGLNVITGDLATARFPDSTFDVVFMGDVLEHLSDPLATCAEVFRILKPGGVFVIECPMQTNTLFSRLGFFVYTLLGKKATVQLPPYHLFEYRPASMRRLLQRCGFDIVQTQQAMIPPSEVTLRGPRIQRAGKKVLQYPNYLLTKLFGVFGDRIEMVATKR
jgi:SAM-dependent methyltransferase